MDWECRIWNRDRFPTHGCHSGCQMLHYRLRYRSRSESASSRSAQDTEVGSGVSTTCCGGDGWESNPPGTGQHRPTNGFEDRGRPPPPTIPGGLSLPHVARAVSRARQGLASTRNRLFTAGFGRFWGLGNQWQEVAVEVKDGGKKPSRSTSGQARLGMKPCTNALYVSLRSRCDSAAMVAKTSELLPEPETPGKTVSRRFGISTLTLFRLFSRAPCTWMTS